MRTPDYIFVRPGKRVFDIPVRMEWYIDPPRSRTILNGRNYDLCHFPALAFGKLFTPEVDRPRLITNPGSRPSEVPITDKDALAMLFVFAPAPQWKEKAIDIDTSLAVLSIPHSNHDGTFCMHFNDDKCDGIGEFWQSAFVYGTIKGRVSVRMLDENTTIRTITNRHLYEPATGLRL